jgi:hypothetical protein
MAAALVALSRSHTASAWVHPGVFIGDAQLHFVKAQIKAGVQPFAQTFQEALQQLRLRLQYYRDYLRVVRPAAGKPTLSSIFPTGVAVLWCPSGSLTCRCQCQWGSPDTMFDSL